MASHPQVRLVPATVELLVALDEDPVRFGELLGSPVPEGWPEFPEAIGFTLEQLRTAPEVDRPWSMQLFVDDRTERLLGSGGFAAPPADRTVEIGYEIAPAFRVERAVASGDVDHVVAHTLPGPNPSTGVLVALGFRHVADRRDPEAGTVWRWRWTRSGAP
jgi:[ribosomal protein S5]-alanine N-acetyltransferase